MKSSENDNKYKGVESKYFTVKNGMDESLCDFQEKKKNNTGPKNIVSNIRKVKKKNKNIKGQKDIRTLFSSNKNDLTTYTRHFNQICKQSGIDIDSDELQLAVALSKSLQEVESNGKCNTLDDYLRDNTEDRTRKICTTLLEYGFKVPEIKINNTSRKIKKSYKSYKLLQNTEIERWQVINDKYSQVLFENLNKSNTKNVVYSENNSWDTKLYYLSTNVDYFTIRDDLMYYNDYLVKKSANTTGSLLKSWSDIPGRPLSPEVHEKATMDVSEIECSQDEFNIILSGTLKAAKNILKSRDNLPSGKSLHTVQNFNEMLEESGSSKEKDKCYRSDSQQVDMENNNFRLNYFNNRSPFKTVVQETRSLSPDIFDEELPTLNTSKIELAQYCHELTSDTLDKDSTDMDLTQPVSNINKKNCLSQKTDGKGNIQISQEINITKRKSNDFMELTDCVVTSFQQLKQFPNKEIHLTKMPENIICTISDNQVDNEIESVDLTQSSSDEDIFPAIHLGYNEQNVVFHDTVILDESPDVLSSDSEKINSKESFMSEINASFKSSNLVRSLEGRLSNKLAYQNNDELSKKSSDTPQETLITSNNEGVEVVKEDINLTQSSSSSVEMLTRNENTEYLNNLGRKDNISIDYDEISYDGSKTSNTTDLLNKSDAVFEVSDEKLYGSSYKFELQSSENIYHCESSKMETLCPAVEQNIFSDIHVDLFSNDSNMTHADTFPSSITQRKNKPVEVNDPQRGLGVNIEGFDTSKATNLNTHMSAGTPMYSKYLIKTNDVSPMLDYASLSTPDRNKELDKYGLKPLKRKRAIQILTHLYNQTHPYIEECTEDEPSPPKKHQHREQFNNSYVSPKKNSKLQSPMKAQDKVDEGDNNIYKVTNDVHIKPIVCNPEELVFQKKERSKVHSCNVPLHVAFHNYVSSRQRLLEAILRYEPVNIDVIHKDFISYGLRYDPKDLLKFLDKKCITVKTSENNGRNNIN